jgi:hypothetical protein
VSSCQAMLNGAALPSIPAVLEFTED